jgi:hypothetical protein
MALLLVVTVVVWGFPSLGSAVLAAIVAFHTIVVARLWRGGRKRAQVVENLLSERASLG